MIVPFVLDQHVENVVALAQRRQIVVKSPHARLEQLLELDRRLEANLNGLRVAGELAHNAYAALREDLTCGGMFTMAVAAIEAGDVALVEELIQISEAVAETASGLLQAFEWVEPKYLRGLVAQLLQSRSAYTRLVGVAACASQRVDPGFATGEFLRDSSAWVVGRVYQAAGELGLSDLLPTVAAAVTTKPDLASGAAWAALLLGGSPERFAGVFTGSDTQRPDSVRTLRLLLQALRVQAAHECAQRIFTNATRARMSIVFAGVIGDAAYVPWLISRMDDDRSARIAGEAFSLITGADLERQALDRPARLGDRSGPNDDPEDPHVELDLDESLPWPDVQAVTSWWLAHQERFVGGQRYFIGAAPTREHCLKVLRLGSQRQRELAAQYVCLRQPGTPLFNTSAPAWRQQRLLASMT